MLSDNIKNYRKNSNMSQDELAEKLGVSRQSISLWETGQTQPTIDNIIALAKIFNVSSDMLLGNSDSSNPLQNMTSAKSTPKKKRTGLILTVVIAAAVIIGAAILAFFLSDNDLKKSDSEHTAANSSVIQSEKPSENSSASNSSSKNVKTDASKASNAGTAGNTSKVSNNGSSHSNNGSSHSNAGSQIASSAGTQLDLFSCCKDFAIKKGTLNGDYCIYQQPAAKYGGYENEYVSVSFWNDSNMVEFCLHCPLSETYSHNFYLRMRGGYNKKYEYLSSKYYRDNGESVRSATGYIDPAVFSDSYPISCDKL